MDNSETIYKFNNIKLFDVKKKIFKNNISIYNENNITHNIFKNINANINLYNLFNDINKSINKSIVYSIKNLDNLYYIEIYLYNNNNLFFEDLLKIVNILNKSKDNINYYEKLFKLFNKYDKIDIISFNININEPYDYKLYIHTKIYDQYIDEIKKIYNATNDLVINSTNNYIIEYDLISQNTSFNSFFIKFNNYNELDNFIKTFQESLYINLNKIIDLFKNICSNPKLIIFYIRFETKLLGIYLIDVNIESLNKFFNSYNYNQLFDLNDKNNKDLTFDIFINFNLLTNKINDTGFFNYL